ncbi:iron chaperone [Chloroflexota bacterium]
MANTNLQVDTYMQNLESDRCAALGRIRSLILQTVPRVKETMRYRMPTYELDEVVCSFASQKHYMSLYMDVELVDQYSDALKHLDVGKSCIRFKRIEDLPLETVQQILMESVEKQKQGDE